MTIFIETGLFAEVSNKVLYPELQAVYLRPEKLTEADAAAYMADIKRWGAKEVFLEDGFDNKVLNRSKIFPVMAEDIDWLEVLCREAKKQGLKVHVWVKIGFWVHKVENLENFPILKEHPDWIDLNRMGQMVSEEGSYEAKHFIFVNYAVPDVIKTELDFIRELCAYGIDGISIDYIRFKYAGDDPTDWYGYNEYSVQRFKSETGLDPHKIKPEMGKGEDFMKWVSYNERLVENCVREISLLIREINVAEDRNIVLSASPFTGYVSGESSKYQNWKPWDDNGYIDLWLPMCMSIDMGMLKKEIEGIYDLGLKTGFYPVVYPNQHGSLHPPLKDHYDVIRECGIQRFAVFSYKQVKNELGSN